MPSERIAFARIVPFDSLLEDIAVICDRRELFKPRGNPHQDLMSELRDA
jgi:hypothetical protein